MVSTTWRRSSYPGRNRLLLDRHRCQACAWVCARPAEGHSAAREEAEKRVWSKDAGDLFSMSGMSVLIVGYGAIGQAFGHWARHSGSADHRRQPDCAHRGGRNRCSRVGATPGPPSRGGSGAAEAHRRCPARLHCWTAARSSRCGRGVLRQRRAGIAHRGSGALRHAVGREDRRRGSRCLRN